MYIRLAVLSLATLSSLGYAMETADNPDQRKMELIQEQIADDQAMQQQLIEANLRKSKRQQEYNALVELQQKNAQTIEQLMKEQAFDQATRVIEQVAQENDTRPMKINPKKLTKFTKVKAMQNIHDNH